MQIAQFAQRSVARPWHPIMHSLDIHCSKAAMRLVAERWSMLRKRTRDLPAQRCSSWRPDMKYVICLLGLSLLPAAAIADAPTRAYVLEDTVSLPAGSSRVSATTVPFDSYITGVSYNLFATRASCAFGLAYESDLLTPGGSNTTKISQESLRSSNSEQGHSGIANEVRYYPLTNRFIGEGESFELRSSGFGDGICGVTALVYLPPAVSGVTPSGIGL
jgi:hypothetical protein